MLAARLYAMLRRIRITDLLSEVARWTLFTDCLPHLRSGETVADPRVLMAGLLADGLNLGLTRMAEACTIASLGQLARAADWHISDETYALALRHLVDHQQREPLATIFGGGVASSSDGQFFRAGGFARDGGRVKTVRKTKLPDATEVEQPWVVGLRDRALIGVMTYSFARIEAAKNSRKRRAA
jgi:Tn3 transposase DDE domain